MMKRYGLLFAGILLLALLLRVGNLGGRPFWYDEAFAQLYAELPLSKMLAGTVTTENGAAADVHPVFYYSLLHIWMTVAGAGPFAVRLLSALLGVGGVAMGILLGAALFDRRTGLIWGLLIAFSPFHLYYSQELRMYALLGFAALSSLYFFVRAWQAGGWWRWGLFSLCGAVTMYAHNLGALFIAGIGLWVLWVWWRERRPVRSGPLFGAAAMMLLLFLPWLLVVPSQLRKIQQAYWVTRPDLLSLLQTTLVFHFSADNQGLPARLLMPAFALALLTPALLLLESRRPRPTAAETFPFPRLFLLFLALGQIGFTFLVSQISPVYIIRALLPAALVYYGLVAAILFAPQTPAAAKWGMGGALLITAVLALAYHYQYADFPRAPFAAVHTVLAAETGENTAIVHSNKLSYFPLYLFDRNLPQRFLADPPGSSADTLAPATQAALGLYADADVQTAVAGANHVFFLIFAQELADYTVSPPHLSWLQEEYGLVGVRPFHDLLIYEFRR
jgi:mannosyltransferase